METSYNQCINSKPDGILNSRKLSSRSLNKASAQCEHIHIRPKATYLPAAGGASVSESELFLLPADPAATPPAAMDFRGIMGDTDRPPAGGGDQNVWSASVGWGDAAGERLLVGRCKRKRDGVERKRMESTKLMTEATVDKISCAIINHSCDDHRHIQ